MITQEFLDSVKIISNISTSFNLFNCIPAALLHPTAPRLLIPPVMSKYCIDVHICTWCLFCNSDQLMWLFYRVIRLLNISCDC